MIHVLFRLCHLHERNAEVFTHVQNLKQQMSVRDHVGTLHVLRHGAPILPPHVVDQDGIVDVGDTVAEFRRISVFVLQPLCVIHDIGIGIEPTQGIVRVFGLGLQVGRSANDRAKSIQGPILRVIRDQVKDMGKQIVVGFRTSYLRAVVVVRLDSEGQLILGKRTAESLDHHRRDNGERTAVIVLDEIHQFLFGDPQFVMEAVIKKQIGKAHQIFRPGEPDLILLVLHRGHTLRDVLQPRERIFLLRYGRIRHDGGTGIGTHAVPRANVFVHGGFDPQKRAATAAHTVIHVEVDLVILVFDTARLIIDFLGEQVGSLGRNLADANRAGIGDQVDTAVLVYAYLLGIVRKSAEGLFRGGSQYLGIYLVLHNHLNANIKRDETVGFV